MTNVLRTRALALMKIAVVMVLAFSLGACTTFAPSVPKDYSGPVAIIKDSVIRHSPSKADFFYLSDINAVRVEDSRSRTREVSYGQGFNMSPSVVERNVPAKEATFTIVGRTEYAAPILALTNSVYQVIGKVTFSPEPYRNYVVRGELGETYSAVWLEDEAEAKVIGEKIEIKGSAKLGTFAK